MLAFFSLHTCVVCTEGESGQHFRDFVAGAVDQDLDGFDDEVEESRQSAPPGDAVPDPLLDQISASAGELGEAGDDEEDEEAFLKHAEEERILREAADFGVDSPRDDDRPAQENAAAVPKEPDVPDEPDQADEHGGEGGGEGGGGDGGGGNVG